MGGVDTGYCWVVGVLVVESFVYMYLVLARILVYADALMWLAEDVYEVLGNQLVVDGGLDGVGLNGRF